MRIFVLFAIFWAVLGLYKDPQCTFFISKFLWGAYWVLACILTIFGSYQIHMKTLAALKGPRIEHIGRFCQF